MKLLQLTQILTENPKKSLNFLLPDKSKIPAHFHVTEIGEIKKSFIDCGGTIRTTNNCSIQIWVANDKEHRLSSEKLSSIFQIAQRILTDQTLDVEVEYENQVVSQYPIIKHLIDNDSITFELGLKHTDCLAKDKCGIDDNVSLKSNTSSCCTDNSRCC